MENLQMFSYESKNIRIIEKGDETWWVLKDVCDVLGLTNATIVASRLDEDEVTKFDLGRQGECNIINESGLYNVILRSDKPEAKKFKRWITSEVLPSIRKNGMYATPITIDQMIANPDFAIELLNKFKNEQLKRKDLEIKVAQDAPKVLFADCLTTSNKDVLIGELAKVIKQNGVDVGQNRLFEWLREKGYLLTKGEYYNQPSQRAMEQELFRIKKSTITNPDGSIRTTFTTKVTPKGQIYFVNKFINKGGKSYEQKH